ncbi:CAP domain-containing protein [Patescibacteria group bacterium]
MKKLGILLFSVTIIFLSSFLFWDDVVFIYSNFNLKLPQVQEEINSFIQETERKIITPSPLITEEESELAFLTRMGTIKWTNIQRDKYGLPPLKENLKLNVSAEAKVEDMFLEQYFAHKSPSGLGVGDLADISDYEYIIIGENLAFGNFKDDETLILAWMNSPGHRENILNDRYQEIGIAVQKGVFEGKTVWLAVQHFALPLEACPQPDAVLKLEIEIKKVEIEKIFLELTLLQSEIRAMRPKKGEVYHQKVQDYNDLVAQYNKLIGETEVLIDTYNLQIKSFNICAAS